MVNRSLEIEYTYCKEKSDVTYATSFPLSLHSLGVRFFSGAWLIELVQSSHPRRVKGSESVLKSYLSREGIRAYGNQGNC